VVVGEVRDEPFFRPKRQFVAAEALAGIERLLIEDHAVGLEQRVGVGGEIVVVGDVPVVGAEIVSFFLCALRWKVEYGSSPQL